MNKREKAIQIRQRMWKEIDKILIKTEQEIVELMKEDAPSEAEVSTLVFFSINELVIHKIIS